MIKIIGRGYQHKGGLGKRASSLRDHCKVYNNPRVKKRNDLINLRYNKNNYKKVAMRLAVTVVRLIASTRANA